MSSDELCGHRGPGGITCTMEEGHTGADHSTYTEVDGRQYEVRWAKINHIGDRI